MGCWSRRARPNVGRDIFGQGVGKQDVALRQVGEIAKHHDLPLTARQPTQCVDQCQAIEDVGVTFRAGPVVRVREVLGRPTTTPSADGEVGRHPGDPRLVVSRHHRPPGVGPAERLLGYLFCFASIAEEPVGHPVGDDGQDLEAVDEVGSVGARHAGRSTRGVLGTLTAACWRSQPQDAPGGGSPVA